MHCKRKKTEHNPDWQEIPDIPHRLLIIDPEDPEKQIHCLI